MSDKLIIDFADLEGPVFTGRARAEKLREMLHVEQYDSNENASVEVKIPDTTYSVSSSFILGLFGKSVVKAGSKQAFYKKYHFQANDLFRGVVDNCVTRALQDKTLFS